MLLPFPARPERFAGCVLELPPRALSCPPAADVIAGLLLLELGDQEIQSRTCCVALNDVRGSLRAATWRT